MAILDVNTTRMELNRLKELNKIAKKGHKLLKDKHDSLIQEINTLKKEISKQREKVKDEINKAILTFNLAKINSSDQSISIAIKFCEQTSLVVKKSEINVMGVSLVSIDVENNIKLKEIPYDLIQTNIFLDLILTKHKSLLQSLVLLSSKEHNLKLLSNEIKKTRRKVNALESLIIPNYQDTIKYISFKLEEMERSFIAKLNRAKIKWFF